MASIFLSLMAAADATVADAVVTAKEDAIVMTVDAETTADAVVIKRLYFKTIGLKLNKTGH